MNYFRFQLKLEMIPYFEEEIEQYIGKLTTNLSTMSLQDKETVKKLLIKKVQQIENFYDHNYLDFRAQMVLKSRKLIIDFMQKYES